MDFDFSDDQKALQHQARRVLGEHGDSAARRAVFESRAPMNRKLWEVAVELGWTGAAIPEAYGGLGLGQVTLCALIEELGRGLAATPFITSMGMAAQAVTLAGSEAQKAHVLTALAAGTEIGTFAAAERPGPIHPAAIASRVVSGRLTGGKIAVPDAGVAGLAVVAARSEAGEVELYLVRLDDPAVTRTPQDGVDPSRPVFRLDFKGAQAEPLDRRPGQGSVLDAMLARAAVLTAFEQLGGAEGALEMARAYALERRAFGRPIAGFQAIRHKLAEVYVANELARSQAYYAASVLEAETDGLLAAAASARLAATAAFEQASRELIQVHGGIGMTWEHDSHLFYRRSRYLALALGDQTQWRETLARALVGRVAGLD